MVGLLIGVVLGGLAIMLHMREHVLRLEAEIESLSLKRQTEVAQQPVKTRAVGKARTSGSKSTRKPVAATAPRDEEE